MSRFLIFGTGACADVSYRYYNLIESVKENEIIGFVDNNKEKWGLEYNGKRIYSPSEITQIDFDYISIWSTEFNKEIYRQLTEELNVPTDRIKDIFEPYKKLLLLKYENSQEKELNDFAKKISNTCGLSIWYFEPENKEEIYEVFEDIKEGMKYVLFEGKRMYFSRSYNNYFMQNGKVYTRGLWSEQDPNSPHLYEKGNVSVSKGDVIVDAGVCEGNFALHHIDDAKKIYLIECDKEWCEALKLTFKPYSDKVIICNKFLSDYDSEKTVTIDSLVDNNEVDFIKMDIEGEEIKALHGAGKTLYNNKHIKCAICSYHHHGDEEKIKDILAENGLQTNTSDGYMLFLVDESVRNYPELRRGIVRGIKA